MKVLHVIPRIAPSEGGLRTGTLAICRAMKTAGIEAEIACLQEDTSDDPIDIPVHRFRSGLKLVGASVEMRDWLYANAANYDAIVAHVVWLNPAHYAVTAAARAGIPLLLASRGMLDPDALQHHRRRKLIRWHLGVRKMLQRSLLVFSSEEDRNRSLTGDLSGVTGFVVPNPVELPEPAEATDPPIVCCLNRIHPRKGVLEFVNAMRALKREGLEFIAVHAGHKEDPAYAATVEAAGEGVVQFKGSLSHSEARSLIARSAIVVHPAVGYENFGNVIAEGMAAGKPVVASRRALVTPQLERAGVVVATEPNDKDLTAAIGELLQDKTVRDELGRRAREYATEHFSMQAVGEQWCKLIQDARASIRD